MSKIDKAALADRLSHINQVAPALSDADPNAVRGIETITDEILQYKLDLARNIVCIGLRLIEAKAMLSHGEWLPWLRENVQISESSAQSYMRVAREFPNPQLVGDLGVRKTLQLLALPESEREEFMAEAHQVNGEEKAVIDMTSRELERAIKERNEAQKAAEQAKADTRAAQETKKSMEKSLNAANVLIDAANREKEQASGRIAELEKQLADLKAAPVEVAIATVDQEKLDAARAEGEAAKAEEIAALQAQLDKAREDKRESDERRKDAEASVDALKLQLEAAAKSSAQASAMADPDVAKFEVYFNQAQEVANKLRGLLLKARGREDQTTAEKLSNAILALSGFLREAAQ